MTDGVIENIAEEVLGTTSKSGFGHLHWLFQFTRALGAPDEVITEATPNVDAMASSGFLYQPGATAAVVRVDVRRDPGDREPDPARPTSRSVDGFKEHYSDILQPDDYAFHTIHITVDEDHGGHVGEFAERYLDTDAKRRSARAAYFAGAELTRRCWDNLSDCTW